MSRPRFAIWMALLACAILLVAPVSGATRRSLPPAPTSAPIVVTTGAELDAALTSNSGDVTIFVQAGTYQLNHAIVIPDGTALIGEGQMLYDASGLPSGFAPAGRTVIAATPGVTGDFVTLQNGSSLHGLVIQDLIRPAMTGGAVVVVSSREPGDSVSAQIDECEIINPNPAGAAPNGPSGRGLLAITRNPRFAPGGGAPHDQSLVLVSLSQSIIRSPAGGNSVFGINFASGSQVEIYLRQNVLGGPFGGAGGASRPDSVVGSTWLIQSNGNLYREDRVAPPSTSLGWNLQAGTDSPVGGLNAQESLSNRLWMHSVDDRIEGFNRAIVADAGHRNFAASKTISSNELELILQGTHLSSLTLDLQLRGASSNVAGMAAGDDNEVRVTMRHVTGSGSRANDYAHSTGNLGSGNQLIFSGSLNSFSHTNDAILPMPGAAFFAGGR